MRPILLRVLGTAILMSLAVGGLLWATSPRVLAQEALSPGTETEADADADDTHDEKARFAAFTLALTNVKLVGRFTFSPADQEPIRDEYTIASVVKVGAADLWIVSARIRYGTVDLTVPVPVEVKWAGKTPVITLDDVTIPGLGTFSSRVVIDGSLYAGTWQHDAVGGHMFGKIVPLTEENPEKVPVAK
jgi:hypothetical protein